MCIRRPLRGPSSALLAAALLASCAEPFYGVELTLVPDPNINTEAMLVELVRTLELELDSSDGLYPLADVRRSATLRIEDVDSDGWAELVVTSPLGTTLPRIQIAHGDLGQEELQLRLTGYDGAGMAVAQGSLVNGFRVPSDSISEIDLYFNTLPSLWPPQVTQSIPANGERNITPTDTLDLFFSRLMDESTLLADSTVELYSLHGTDQHPIPAFQKTAFRSGGRSSLRYSLEQVLQAGSYRLEVSVAALSVATAEVPARPLDQQPTVDGNQPYVAVFTVAASSASTVAYRHVRPRGPVELPAPAGGAKRPARGPEHEAHPFGAAGRLVRAKVKR